MKTKYNAFRDLAKDTAVNFILAESVDAAMFARRIEAWASTQSVTYMDTVLCKLYRGCTVEMIRAARKDRLTKKKALWTRIEKNLNKDVES